MRKFVNKSLLMLSLATVLSLSACNAPQAPQYQDHDLLRSGKIQMPKEYQEEQENLDKLNETLQSKEEGHDRIVAGSVALCQIMDKLNINLVGRPLTHLGQLPPRYEQTKLIGMPMNPDMELIYSLKPTVVYSPDSLKDWLAEGFEKHHLPIEFVNLKSVDALYKAVEAIGTRFHKEQELDALLSDYQRFLQEYQLKKPEKPLKVLLLMGLPGSYVVATPVSYAGSLLEMSGAENVFPAPHGEEFLNVSVEEMLSRDPDIILRTVHAMPDLVHEMFRKEFQSNPIWSHFRALKEGHVYDLDSTHFGMSALFNYCDGLEELQTIYAKLNNGSDTAQDDKSSGEVKG